jgi:hypothetical protein
MEKTTIRIDNVFSSIVGSSDYKRIEDKEEYTNRIQPQKEILKSVLIPKVRDVITELTSNNEQFECIQIEKVISKYSKDEKYVKIELVYNDDREYITYIHKSFDAFRIELWNRLLKYNLYVA